MANPLEHSQPERSTGAAAANSEPNWLNAEFAGESRKRHAPSLLDAAVDAIAPPQAEPFLKEGIKTAAMFMRGRIGLAATVAACALDECKLTDKPQEQATDLALGSLKGLGLKLMFSKTGQLDAAMKLVPMEYNLPARAAVMGLASRTIDVGLSRSTWVDASNSKFDAGRSAQIVGSQILNPVALSTDVAAFAVSGGLLKGGNFLSNGAIGRSPLLSTIVVGSGFGISAGGSAELIRQNQANEHLDLGKVASHAFIQGAVDAVAAVPGGKQADCEATRIFSSMSLGDAHPGKASAGFENFDHGNAVAFRVPKSAAT